MINAALTAFNDGFRLFKDNAWTVGLAILVIVVVKDQLRQFKSKFFLDGQRAQHSAPLGGQQLISNNVDSAGGGGRSATPSSSSSPTTATSSSADHREHNNNNDDTRRQQARWRQQELCQERTKIAVAEREKKKAAERQKKLQLAKEQRQKDVGKGQRLGSSTDSAAGTNTTTSSNNDNTGGGGGYNPMQPWSSGRASGAYRPARRQVQRG